MDKSKIENAINHIISLQEKLCYCENNLQYIKRLQALKYWLHKLIHFWIGTAGSMVNMQQFMKATSILAVGSHFTIEYAIQFLFMNMATDHFKELMQKKEHYFKCSFWHCSISPCKYSSLTEQSKVLAVEDFLKSILYRFISFL